MGSSVCWPVLRARQGEGPSGHRTPRGERGIRPTVTQPERRGSGSASHASLVSPSLFSFPTFSSTQGVCYSYITPCINAWFSVSHPNRASGGRREAMRWGMPTLVVSLCATPATSLTRDEPAQQGQAAESATLPHLRRHHHPHMALQAELSTELERLSMRQLRVLLLGVHGGTVAPEGLLGAARAQASTDDSSWPGRLLADEGRPSPLQAVPLFRKPASSTGQLVLVKEGLDVLRAQVEPFSIISAVGPTRTGKSSILGRVFMRNPNRNRNPLTCLNVPSHTGKSSILGRAFMRGPAENLFEIGSGVTSFTGGVWITSEPLLLSLPPGGPPGELLVNLYLAYLLAY